MEEMRKELEELKKACNILRDNDMECSEFFKVTEPFKMLAKRIAYLYDCLGEYDSAEFWHNKTR